LRDRNRPRTVMHHHGIDEHPRLLCLADVQKLPTCELEDTSLLTDTGIEPDGVCGRVGSPGGKKQISDYVGEPT
jgi:hypothetical protein